MKLAIVSLDSVWEDKQANLKEVERIVASLSPKVEYVVFPEMSLTGFSISNLALAEDFESSSSLQAIQKMAKEYQMNIVFGLMISKDKKKYNSCIAVNNKGEIAGTYEKIHLFSYAGEDELIVGGNQIKSLPWNGGWGLSICFDLRFPELYQELSKENLILLNIANWPKGRVSHWRALLNARAIENQSFMIGVNRTGIDGNGLEYEESSCVFSPTGEKLEPLEIFEEIKIFDLNLENAIEYRKNFPIKKDRKNSIYREFYN
ncbi:nitrilase-related carbon-nitrogen hydrolase [Flavobacterium piscisymbiosum]|uniref:Hydrolase n=1 Tax=Flavobacterium piscisymbiosum TaxID=2893753 RepID=A0ABS8M8D8_9FLAO|nr:nitrilase-related carbon-nitrogen hydrolase [Flavobacterium sp. F-30]MCC9061748.1 hydrolase [Flavobacterium sp. F-30]